MKNAKELIKDMDILAKQYESLQDEIVNNPEVPQEIKSEIIKMRENFKKEQEVYKKYLEENKHRKIIGFNPENFKPICEDE